MCACTPSLRTPRCHRCPPAAAPAPARPGAQLYRLDARRRYYFHEERPLAAAELVREVYDFVARAQLDAESLVMRFAERVVDRDDGDRDTFIEVRATAWGPRT